MKNRFAITFIAISMITIAASEGGQCSLSSFPPKAETGCCGREARDSDRINDGEKSGLDFRRFPWAALLKVTFNRDQSAINCGGSLISSRYVLTAAHCVYAEGGKTVDYSVEVSLAEYDKGTFPKDCKNIPGQGQECIDNVVMKAEEVVVHPQYEGKELKNDIALLRLQFTAPYTDYIRPICLPSIDVDSLVFSGLRLAVTGWGQNGENTSDIKQSGIVSLVTQEKCKKYYPELTRLKMCAVGYAGQDVCKGDDGDPLMMMYGGKYQLVGFVSGKRAGSSCGSSVPSLYVNVYHYIDWIRNTIRK